MAPPNDRALAALRKWAVLLDSAFHVPGTRVRFGLDPIIGLLPGGGDLVTGFFSALILIHAVRLRVPRVVMGRMVLNAGIDMLAGVVPVLGDIVDVAWKANVRNLALLERHAHGALPPAPRDYLFVGVAIAVLVLLAVVPLALLWWILAAIF